jgi:hypothetical protein
MAIPVYLHDSGQSVQELLQPMALMTSLPLTLIGVVLALLMFRSALSMFSSDRRGDADEPGHQERDFAGGLCHPVLW